MHHAYFPFICKNLASLFFAFFKPAIQRFDACAHHPYAYLFAEYVRRDAQPAATANEY